MSEHSSTALFGVSAGAVTAFAAVAVASATRRTAHIDRKLAARIAFRGKSRVRKLAAKASPYGKWYVLVPASMALGALVATTKKRPGAAGAAIGMSGVGAFVLSQLCDRVLPQPPVPPGHRNEPHKPVFPSGHAFIATSVFGASAYILVREELAHPAVAYPVAFALPVVSTWMKLAAKKHWPSDALAGVLGGVAVAMLCCAAYERTSNVR